MHSSEAFCTSLGIADERDEVGLDGYDWGQQIVRRKILANILSDATTKEMVIRQKSDRLNMSDARDSVVMDYWNNDIAHRAWMFRNEKYLKLPLARFQKAQARAEPPLTRIAKKLSLAREINYRLKSHPRPPINYLVHNSEDQANYFLEFCEGIDAENITLEAALSAYVEKLVLPR